MAEGLLDKANIILTPTGYKAGTMYNVAPIEQPYEDFDFARASVASRVNSSGLIEMVGRTLGSNLVQNGDFSEIGPDLVQNGTFDLGPELVTNGDFATDSDWSTTSTWDIVNNQAEAIGNGISQYIQQDFSITNGNVYKFSYEIIENTLNGNGASLSSSGGFGSVSLSNVVGTHTEYITASNDAATYALKIGVSGTATTGTIKIDNVSVKEVDPNNYWSTTSTVTVKDGFANITSDGSYQYLRQLNIVEVGKSYKLTYEITRQGSGVLKSSSLGLNSIPSTVGTHTVYGLSSQTYIVIDRASACDIDITNIVVQELDPNDYWNLETGWSLGDNQAIKTGSVASNFYQYSVFTTGQTYKLTFTISNSNDGRLLVYVGGNSVTEDITNTSDGTYTFYANSDNVNLVFRNVTFEGSITNVTAQEVIDTNNIPRINYDSNGENGHWLLEPTSTNLVTYSEDFTQWTLGSNSTLTYESDVVAPDGSLGVYRLTLPATSSTYIQSPLFTYNNPITLSIYAKYADASNNEFDLYDGTNTTKKITTSEWQRFDAVGFGNQLTIVNHGDTYITDIYIWGGQAEALSYATSYIPTLTGSTETRATETANGAGSADLINSTEGVLYAEIAALADSTTTTIFSLSNGTNANTLYMGFSSTSNTIQAQLVVGNVAQTNMNYVVTDRTQFNKVAVLYQNNNHKMYINGSEVAVDKSGSVPSANTFDRLNFDLGQGSFDFYGKCKELTVFGEALSDDELEKLTSWSSFNAMATDLGYTIE